jgi:hypothetical protein
MNARRVSKLAVTGSARQVGVNPCAPRLFSAPAEFDGRVRAARERGVDAEALGPFRKAKNRGIIDERLQPLDSPVLRLGVILVTHQRWARVVGLLSAPPRSYMHRVKGSLQAGITHVGLKELCLGMGGRNAAFGVPRPLFLAIPVCLRERLRE